MSTIFSLKNDYFPIVLTAYISKPKKGVYFGLLIIKFGIQNLSLININTNPSIPLLMEARKKKTKKKRDKKTVSHEALKRETENFADNYYLSIYVQKHSNKIYIYI